MNKHLLLFFVCVSTSACATFVPVTDISKVPPDQLHLAYAIKVYTTEQSGQYGEIAEYLGDITAYSCKHMMWDPPASKADALTQLRLKALGMKANGIIDVTFNSRGTDTFGTNCWESVQASGVAVEFKTK